MRRHRLSGVRELGPDEAAPWSAATHGRPGELFVRWKDDRDTTKGAWVYAFDRDGHLVCGPTNHR